MDIGTEIALGRLTLHGGHHFAVDHEAANISSLRFFDEFLHENFSLHRLERVDEGFSRLIGFGEDDADALRALQ